MLRTMFHALDSCKGYDKLCLFLEISKALLGSSSPPGLGGVQHTPRTGGRAGGRLSDVLTVASPARPELVFSQSSLNTKIVILTLQVRNAVSARTPCPDGSKAWTPHCLLGKELTLTTIFSKGGNKGTDHQLNHFN